MKRNETTAVSRSRDSDALRTAFGREGCPVCTVVLGSLEHFMDTWQYEGFSDVEHRQELIRSRGFCPLHTWQLAQHNAAFQLAVVYSEVLTNVEDELNYNHQRHARANQSIPIWKPWQRKRPDQFDTNSIYARCPICKVRGNVEERIVETLLEQLHSEEVRSLLSQSTGLCLMHFYQAHNWANANNPALLPHLLECQHTCVQRVLEEVKEQIRKHDYRFSDEPWGEEMVAWRRAAELCAGNPGIR
jgi:Family of unknown function (DUF6062)